MQIYRVWYGNQLAIKFCLRGNDDALNKHVAANLISSVIDKKCRSELHPPDIQIESLNTDESVSTDSTANTRGLGDASS